MRRYGVSSFFSVRGVLVLIPLMPLVLLILFMLLMIWGGILCGCSGKGNGRGGKSGKAQGACRSNDNVVLYCSADQEIAEPIIAKFEKLYGIRVKARYDTEAGKTLGLVQRIRSQAGSVGADVFWSSEPFHTIRLGRDGLLVPYADDITGKWPKQYCGRKVEGGRYWYGFAMRARVIAYNTNNVIAGDAPHSLEDLLDSKWKGEIVMARPEFGTTSGDVASWYVHYGKVRFEEILRGLKANDIRIVASNSTAVRMVAMGQAYVCITDTDDVYAAKRNKWPVGMHFMQEQGAAGLVIPNTVCMLKNGRNKNAARKLMKFLLSGQVEMMLLKSDSHNWPIRFMSTWLEQRTAGGRDNGEYGKYGKYSRYMREYSRYAISGSSVVDYYNVADNLLRAVMLARGILE